MFTVNVFSFVCVFVSLVEGSSVSNFVKIGIIDDTCSVKLLKMNTVSDMEDCGALCSEDVDCRRFLYCSSTSQCTLFVDNGDCQVTGPSSDCSCFKKTHGCIDETIHTCPLGYYGNECKHVIQDCAEAGGIGITYTYPVLLDVQPPGAGQPFELLCFAGGDGGWAYLLYRSKECQFENFNRTLKEYKTGFGNSRYNKWLGFDKILQLMRVENNGFALNMLAAYGNNLCQSYYSGFGLDDTDSKYSFQSEAFNPGVGTTSCGDSILGVVNLQGNPFSTYDRDLTGNNECANKYGGGWWFEPDTEGSECSRSFLTGKMNDSEQNVFWMDDLGSQLFERFELRFYRHKVTENL